MMSMSNKLFLFDLTVPLTYYTYQLYSYSRQSEYVMGFENEIKWEENNQIKDNVETNVDKMYFHIFCNYEKDNSIVPEDHFICEIKNIIAENESEAYKFIHPRLYKICRTLSFTMNMYNDYKNCFQPRVEVDFGNLLWSKRPYKFNNTNNNVQQLNEDINIAIHIADQIVTKVYTKGISNMSLENFFEYFNSTNSDLNYMLDELYLALGKENVQSKFFHLFSIMEFIEKRFIKFSGASNLLTEDEVDKIVKYLSNIDMDFGKDKIEKITNTFRSNMLKMTDYGRATKLANILNYMGIKKIKYLNETIGVNGKEVAQIIKIRNCLFHGDVNGLKEDIDKKIQIAVEKLLIICGMIIEWVAGTDNAGINCDG